jgi:hypothetical protein
MKNISEYPIPICGKCNKPVETFTMTIEKTTIKFEVECHSGYEMWRIKKESLENVINIEQGFAF